MLQAFWSYIFGLVLFCFWAGGVLLLTNFIFNFATHNGKVANVDPYWSMVGGMTIPFLCSLFMIVFAVVTVFGVGSKPA